MNWEEKGLELVKVLTPVYKPQSEEKLLKSIISALYHQSVDIDDAERMMMSIYDNLPNHTISRTDTFKLLEDIFVGEIKSNSGIKSMEDVLTVDYNNKLASKAIKKVEKIIYPEKYLSNSFEISDNAWISIDTLNNEVQYQSVSVVKNERVTNTSKILLCRPYSIIIHEDPLYEGMREFTITWKTVNGSLFTTRKVGLSEIESQLYESGYVINNKYLKVAVTAIIQIFIDNGLAEIKNEIQASGFYYDKTTKQLNIVDYELKPVVTDEVKQSLLLIEDLAHFFVGVEDKLATTLKHGLIAPFGFAKKQMGLPLEYLIPYLFHYGKAGSGKTTIARVGLWFYERPSVDKNDIGGTEFDTVPRIGEQLRKSTFGILVNEPETSLTKKSCASTLKTTVERTNSRQKIRGNRMEHILALAMVSFASNVPLPNHEGLPRRFVQILYTHNEKKTIEEKDAFMKHFNLNNPDECEFNKLQYLANFAVNKIKEDTNLLKLDWKTLGNTLIKQAYEYCGLMCPSWLLSYTESISDEEMDEEEIEEIRMFFLNEVNRQSNQIKLYSSEDGYPINQEAFYSEDIKDSLDFEEKVWNVINEGLIPYMVTRQGRDGIKEVCFLSGLKKVLNNNDITCYNLGSTAELLGWDYSPTYLNGKTTRCMRVNFRSFLKFLYPSMEVYDED